MESEDDPREALLQPVTTLSIVLLLTKYRKHIKVSSHSVYMQVRKISRKEMNLLK